MTAQTQLVELTKAPYSTARQVGDIQAFGQQRLSVVHTF